MRGSQALPLAVDPIRHVDEIERFGAHVVRGPEADDCWIFTGPIGGDGYGRFWIRRGGGGRIMLRANRYALAVSLKGEPLQPWERALHGCDNPFFGGFHRVVWGWNCGHVDVRPSIRVD
jgi:hypothetical protein